MLDEQLMRMACVIMHWSLFKQLSTLFESHKTTMGSIRNIELKLPYLYLSVTPYYRFYYQVNKFITFLAITQKIHHFRRLINRHSNKSNDVVKCDKWIKMYWMKCEQTQVSCHLYVIQIAYRRTLSELRRILFHLDFFCTRFHYIQRSSIVVELD